MDTYYFTSTWQDTYKDNIRPVNGERQWKKTGKDPIDVSEKKRMPRRPKNFARIKESHESSSNPTKAIKEGRTITCGSCKKSGHNRSTCETAHVVQAGPKRKRGRPQKLPTSY